MQERPFNLRNTFVQKTYRGPDARQQYHAERNAYLKITQKNAPPPFIIAYYGSFIDEDTFNIILEYADRRNLEDFMKNTGQPSTVEDMIELWDRLGCITHGLACIHGITDGEHGSVTSLSTQDIRRFIRLLMQYAGGIKTSNPKTFLYSVEVGRHSSTSISSSQT